MRLLRYLLLVAMVGLFADQIAADQTADDKIADDKIADEKIPDKESESETTEEYVYNPDYYKAEPTKDYIEGVEFEYITEDESNAAASTIRKDDDSLTMGPRDFDLVRKGKKSGEARVSGCVAALMVPAVVMLAS